MGTDSGSLVVMQRAGTHYRPHLQAHVTSSELAPKLCEGADVGVGQRVSPWSSEGECVSGI